MSCSHSTLSFLFLILTTITIDTVTADTPDQIIQIFRHGARGPNNNYDSTWPSNSLGVLTPAGIRQQYILGKALARRYPTILGAAYDFNRIYMISDTTPRCIQSSIVQLYGIYEGTGLNLTSGYPADLAIPPFQDTNVTSIASSINSALSSNASFDPTIVNIVGSNNRYIFAGHEGIYCPNMPRLQAQNQLNPDIQRASTVFADTITNINTYLPNYMNIGITSGDMLGLGDTFLCDHYANKSLPYGITDTQLINNYTFLYTYMAYNRWKGSDAAVQLAAYNSLAEVINQLKAYRQGDTYNTAAFYSAHDSNIMAVLTVYNIINSDCILQNFASFTANGTLVHPECQFPFFGASFIVELYNQTQSPYVKVYYNNILVPVCNGQSTCDLNTFIQKTNDVTGNNDLRSFFQKCGATQNLLNNMGINLILYPNGSPTDGSAGGGSTGSGSVNRVRPELIACIVLAVLCVALLGKIFYDRRGYIRLRENWRLDTKKIVPENAKMAAEEVGPEKLELNVEGAVSKEDVRLKIERMNSEERGKLNIEKAPSEEAASPLERSTPETQILILHKNV